MPSRFGFKKKRRIIKSHHFQSLYKSGTRLYGRFYKIFFSFAQRQAFGIVISKKIKGSVKRNRYKRLLREYFRLNQGKFKNDLQLIIIVTQEVNIPTFDLISKEIDPVLLKNKKLVINNEKA